MAVDMDKPEFVRKEIRLGIWSPRSTLTWA
jgi:hypothetical protein